jgi:hypothetical protein
MGEDIESHPIGKPKGFMTDQNKSQESEQKWSPTPWIVGDALEIRSDLWEVQIFDANGINWIFCHGTTKEKAEANAARIVACVNFCAGICIETLTLLNQADHPTLQQICERNQSLEKENKALQSRAEQSEQKVRSLEAENQCDICVGTGVSESGKPCACGGSGKMSDVAIYLRLKFFNEVKAREVAEQSLESSRAAKEWILKYGDDILLALMTGYNLKGYAISELRTLLETLNKE